MAKRDWRSPDHLPNLLPEGKARHPGWLPRQRRGVTPQMIGRYPDFDVFAARRSWDRATARAIDERMRVRVGDPLQFFTETEAATGRAFCDACMAQDDEPRIPVLEMIDRRLAAGQLDGYQYDDMPDDRDTWRLVLAGLDEMAALAYGATSFAACDPDSAVAIVGQLAEGQVAGDSWKGLDAKRAWVVCTRMIVTAFYAHPWAWNEIGFGGPAYPRGFMRMGPVGYREPFETPGATSEDPAAQIEHGDR
ncbi:MAG: gluconate 2-dehydrogenase subunit 3 family protein [Acidimicrobiales bacterium]|nr:gluconate 2-dehydrogenase subunit 3 family protein [Acidimicrobiales bacterium]